MPYPTQIYPSNPTAFRIDEQGFSEEVQELIGDVPSWILRWGITVFFGLFLLLGLLTWVIRYPDLIKAPLVMTTTDAPKTVTAKIAGRLTKLFVKDGDMVKEKTTLAYLESIANHEEVLALSASLENLNAEVSKGTLARLELLASQPFDHLGELQGAFQTFNQSYVVFASYLYNGYYQKRKNMMASELNDIDEMKKRLADQRNLYQQDYAFAAKEYNMHKSLAKQGVETTLEMNREESKFLSKQLPIKQIDQNLVTLNTQRTSKQKEMVELDKQLFEIRNNLVQSFLTLKSAVENWKSNYILNAYTAGRVSFAQVLQEKQLLAVGQELFVIVPSNSALVGMIKVPQLNFGKVKIGQKVLIRFNGYPSAEYGLVKGQIKQIAEVPAKDSSFLASVTLPNGMQTTYHKKLNYKNGMNAQAEIITDDLRLLERVFYELRKLMER